MTKWVWGCQTCGIKAFRVYDTKDGELFGDGQEAKTEHAMAYCPKCLQEKIKEGKKSVPTPLHVSRKLPRH